MSTFINALKNEYEEKNQDKITFSIRLSVKEDLILQEVCDAYDLSRQELIHRVITEQVIQAWESERTKDKFIEENEHNEIIETSKESINVEHIHCYLLNTNSANDIADHDFMLTEKVAAAFEDGYKEKITRLQKGDWVFLYASGQGIVAYGQANGIVEKTAHYTRADKTFFQRLDNFAKLKTPMKAREVKHILNREFPFAQTLVYMHGGDKLLEEIKKLPIES